MAGGRLFVGSPSVVQLPFGILSVADVENPSDPHWQLGLEFEPEQCGIPYVYGSQCPIEPDDSAALSESPDTGEKDALRGVALGQSDPFTVYSRIVCTPVGGIYERFEARARNWLINGRERAIENEVALGTAHNGQTLTNSDTVDITPTPGTPVTVSQGIALLEQWIAENGAGLGTILGARRDVLLGFADYALVQPTVGQKTLYTALNTPVAALGGFDGRTGPTDAPPAGTGEAWLFATGSRIVVRESDMVSFPRRESVDTAFNNLYAMAEQTFTVNWACGTAAILVSSVG